MEARFSVQADPSRDLIRIVMSGFFTVADVAAFADARAAAHRKLRCGPNQHRTLNDLRDIKIQSQDIVVAFQQLLASPDYRSRRLAFVVSPTLARSQLCRALSGRDARTFPTVEAAEHWLFLEQSEAIAC